MAEFVLPTGYKVSVDPDDLHFLEEFKWYARRTPTKRENYYVCRATRFAGRLTTQYLHRLLVPAPKGMVVDHINGNGLDNRRSNLRVITQALNTRSQIRPTTKTGYRGVAKNPNGPSYTAYIVVEGKKRSLGSYPTAEDAAKARDLVAQKTYGEFACLNFSGDVAT